MTTPHKRRTLGDEGDSDPGKWLWGGPGTRPVDLLLLCYSNSEETLQARIAAFARELDSHGLEESLRLDTLTLPDFREHFGFRDGIGQPYIAEFDQHSRGHPYPVPLGEFVLGYKNGYDLYTPRPMVAPAQDPGNLLPPDPEGSEQRDLGKNGTYLVFRQLAQDVPGFWRTLDKLAAEAGSVIRSTVQLASKMVGRWPSGTSLVQSPGHDDPDVAFKDDFLYQDSDSDGQKCPLGAHVRRTHPRDSLPPEPGSQKSLDFSNRHRLLRRGRAWGKAFDPSMNPEVFLEKLRARDVTDDEPRGLHFICLNANIGRQFEFVQHTWSNNPGFNGLRHEPDPISGSRNAFGRTQDQFTVQKEPFRHRLGSLPAFVHTLGGGYFFLPGRSALRYLFRQTG